MSQCETESPIVPVQIPTLRLKPTCAETRGESGVGLDASGLEGPGLLGECQPAHGGAPPRHQPELPDHPAVQQHPKAPVVPEQPTPPP